MVITDKVIAAQNSVRNIYIYNFNLKLNPNKSQAILILSPYIYDSLISYIKLGIDVGKVEI